MEVLVSNAKRKLLVGGRLPWMLLALLGLVVVAAAGRAAELEVDFAMDDDPRFEPPPTITTFSPKLKPLWLEALAGPEADLQRQAAYTIALAHQRGMPDLEETAAPLMDLMEAPDQHPVVLLAAARALVVLDARQAAPLLFKHAKTDGLDMAQLAEPALARWDHPPIRKMWLDRLSASRTPRRLLILAIRGLAAVDEKDAEPPLRLLAVTPDADPDVRLEAARALGKIRTDGLEDDARKLAQDRSSEKIVDRLVAASLVSGHRGEAAQALLLELAVDPAPSVAALALTRLLEIDPLLVIPIVEPTIANEDANVRHLGAKALVARATPKAIALLGPMLDDPHVEVRRYVRRSLLRFASDPQLRVQVLEEAAGMLATDRWRGLEQASLLLAALDHKPAADRLVELLDFQRPEVFVTAAWGLRRLAIPATLDRMFDKAERLTETFRVSPWTDESLALQVRQLFEAFGQMKYMRSDSLLREYIPKSSPFRAEPRAAAIWALGHLHAGSPQPELVRLLSARLADDNPDDPEDDLVRAMSAVSLGRMKAEASLPTLRAYGGRKAIYGPIEFACCWAIQQITGQPMPKLGTHVISPMDWFLTPID